ncbi:MAG: lipoyl(octanoyl) transferase LipB [Gammaproteobacteria bacterium]|nr:lipoyl(octanoyl) transferase LipB [Gammaproteobacteria bacterium]
MSSTESVGREVVTVRHFGRQDYVPVWRAMQQFTETRTADAQDELWVVEHLPVYTQGMNGKPEHLLDSGGIPVVQVDRGGQVTYHGPGQAVIYLLLDLRRRGWGVRRLVSLMEQTVIELLADYGISARARADAPGVYVADKKIAALGLRVRHGCTYHGLSLNVAMDLEPFRRINPCGHVGMEVTQVSDLGGPDDLGAVSEALLKALQRYLG